MVKAMATPTLLAFSAIAPSSTAFIRAPTLRSDARKARAALSRRRPPLRLGRGEEREGAEAGSDAEAGGRGDTGVTSNPLELASWYAVEAFGKAFRGDGNQEAAAALDDSQPPSSLTETLERVRRDMERSYFLSGDVDRYIYDEACTFSDPFVAFDGRERFIDNLANLGSFITNYDTKMIKYEVNDDGRVIDAKLMVKLELNLPWKPILAWPWGVRYIVDPDTCLVTDHIESWDIPPLEGIKQIFRRPTTKIIKK